MLKAALQLWARLWAITLGILALAALMGLFIQWVAGDHSGYATKTLELSAGRWVKSVIAAPLFENLLYFLLGAAIGRFVKHQSLKHVFAVLLCASFVAVHVDGAGWSALPTLFFGWFLSLCALGLVWADKTVGWRYAASVLVHAQYNLVLLTTIWLLERADWV